MTILEAIILGAVQGVTEFLPISSSGHLVLAQDLMGLSFSSLKSFDVVVHLGSLTAILLYFSKDVKGLIGAFFRFVLGKREEGDEYESLMGLILLGTLPAVIVGFTLEDQIDHAFRSPTWVATWMIIVALYFVLGEFIYKRRERKELGVFSTIMVGCFQALALIPGVSRSGSTITTGMIGGLTRERAARFSFLLGIPAISGAGLLTAIKMSKEGLGVEILPLVLGFFSSFVLGILSIYLLMKLLKRHTLLIFAVYLMILGGSYLLI